jgi:hypothetical protein
MLEIFALPIAGARHRAPDQERTVLMPMARSSLRAGGHAMTLTWTRNGEAPAVHWNARRSPSRAAPFSHQGDQIMLQRMDAEILFLDPNDVGPGSAVLIEHGFDVEVLDDWVDDYGPTIFIRARITTDVAEDRFLDWVVNIVEPLHGDVVEAGLSHPPQASA